MICLRKLMVLSRSPPWQCYVCGSKRRIFTPSSLGIDLFISRKNDFLKSYKDPGKFKRQLKEICERNDSSFILLNDLSKMIKMTETEDDLKLLLFMVKKYCSQGKKLELQRYSFGPELMRLLYWLSKPCEAVELVRDVDIFPYLQQFKSVLVLLDLLYKNAQYETLIQVFELYFKRDGGQTKNLANYCSLVYFAACYKLNSEECFEKAYQLIQNTLKRNERIPMRSALFFVALSINQNKPLFALETFHSEYLSSVPQNFKFMALAQANRFQEILTALRYLMDIRRSEFFLTKEAVYFIQNEMKNKNCVNEYVSEFDELIEMLLARNMIVKKSLDEFICQEIECFKPKKPIEEREGLKKVAFRVSGSGDDGR